MSIAMDLNFVTNQTKYGLIRIWKKGYISRALWAGFTKLCYAYLHIIGIL